MKYSEKYVKFLEAEIERLEKKVSELEFIVCDYEEGAKRDQTISHNTHIRQSGAEPFIPHPTFAFGNGFAPDQCLCRHCQDSFTVTKDKV